MEKDNLQKELKKRHLTHMITEAVVLALYEQDQMQQLAPPPPAASAPPTPQEVEQAGAPTPDQLPPPVDAPPQINAEQITLDMLIERLNIVRGGKSFTDPEVYGQLTTYFKGIPIQNREIIYKYLLQLSKVVTSNTREQTGEGDTQTTQQPQEQAPPTPAPQAPPVAPQQAIAPPPITPQQNMV